MTAADAALDLYAEGRLPLALAAMRVVLATADRAALDAALARARLRWGEAAIAPLAARLDAAAEARLRAVAGAVDHGFRDADPLAVLARVSAGFDRAAEVSPEAGVALYSLGDAAILAALTAQVVDWLRAERLIAPGLRVLDVGCGAGRFLQALAPDCALAVGVELSPVMAAEAARRLSDAPNVLVARGSGGDLGFVATASVDLVLWADSFPYVVQAGGDLPRRMLAESARVVRPAGSVVVLNWSYRDDADGDARQRADLAARCGLVQTSRPAPRFHGWDASVAVFRRAPGAQT